jgi:hypothetical protein
MGKPIRFFGPLAAVAGVLAGLLLADFGSPADVRAQTSTTGTVCQEEPSFDFIDGSPLNIAANGEGQVNVSLDDSEDEYGCEYFPSDDLDDPQAGLNIANYDLSGEFLEVYGYRGEERFTNVSGPLVAGTPGCSPCTLTSVYTSAGTTIEQIELTITEVHSYVSGNTFFDTSYTIQNTSPPDEGAGDPRVRFRATVSADLCLGGSDNGVGTFSSGPPRFVGAIPDLDDPGCAAPTTLSREFRPQQTLASYAGGFEEVAGSPWTAFEEDTTSEIVDKIENPDGGFDNSINETVHDAMVGIQFDDFFDEPGLAQGGSFQFDVRWPLRRTPTSGDGGFPTPPGGFCPGFPFCSPGGGGGGTGDGDGDPGGTVLGQSFNLRLLSGECFVDGEPLEDVKKIPVGSIVNCRNGVALLFAAKPGGGVQRIRVWNGAFKVASQSTQTGLTILKLVGPLGPTATSASADGEPVATAARKRRSRGLFARSTGRFRTRGRVASATVRGTTWRMVDTRIGTWTKVLKGKGVRLCTRQRPRRCRVLRAGQSRLIAVRR